jgi:hypothetical protein
LSSRPQGEEAGWSQSKCEHHAMMSETKNIISLSLSGFHAHFPFGKLFKKWFSNDRSKSPRKHPCWQKNAIRKVLTSLVQGSTIWISKCPRDYPLRFPCSQRYQQGGFPGVQSVCDCITHIHRSTAGDDRSLGLTGGSLLSFAFSFSRPKAHRPAWIRASRLLIVVQSELHTLTHKHTHTHKNRRTHTDTQTHRFRLTRAHTHTHVSFLYV